MTTQIYFSGTIWTISFTNWPLDSGRKLVYKWTENHTYWSLKNYWGTQSKTIFKICDGMWCSSFYAQEFDVIFHNKIISLYNPINFCHFVPTSLANLVVQVGTRHSHHILLIIIRLLLCTSFDSLVNILRPKPNGTYFRRIGVIFSNDF